MSADRTLMSAVRTSFSLVSFGFTIEQVFKDLQESHVVRNAGVSRDFGEVLIYLGVGMMCAGILFHVQFIYGLRRLRQEMKVEGLIRGESRFPISYTVVIAVLVVVVGIWAMTT
jgi:putative membrane protein